jgi:hypothetical protein
LHRALEQVGADHETHFISNADHVFNGATPEQFEDIVSNTTAFIIRHTTNGPEK